MLTMLDLFSGIGGFSLAAAWTGGIRTVAFCEIEPFCQKVLHKHWSEVPVHADIKELNGHNLVREHGAIDIVCGGFPCQPFSCAGQRRGKDDDRYLWPEMLRVITEVRPTWVIGENVENATRLILDELLDNLEEINYEARPFVISSYCAGAWFDGKRVFVVASSNDRGGSLWRNTQFQTVNKTDGGRRNDGYGTPEFVSGERWKIESRPCGVVDGIPHRVDRIRGLGNAIVPQVVYPIFQAIVEIEQEIDA